MLERVIENVTDEEIAILDKEGIEWYPDDMENRNIVIEGDENYCNMALHAIRRIWSPNKKVKINLWIDLNRR